MNISHELQHRIQKVERLFSVDIRILKEEKKETRIENEYMSNKNVKKITILLSLIFGLDHWHHSSAVVISLEVHLK